MVVETVAGGLRLLAYLRVSTEGQIDGYGFDSQRTDVGKAAERGGHVIIDWMEERGISGTLDETGRPTFFECLERIKNDPDVHGLAVANLGRFARQLTVQEACLAKVWSLGGQVLSAMEGLVMQDDADDPMRTAMRQMAGVFYQLDRAMVVKRLKDGRRSKAERGQADKTLGKAVGAIPYGWRSEREPGKPSVLVPVPEEQEVIGAIRRMDAGGLSSRKIEAALNGQQIPSPKGGQWNYRQVLRILADMAKYSAA